MISLLRNFLSEDHFLRRWYSAGHGILATFFFGFPASSLHIIGVTGTDGKTTTVEMIAHILRHSGEKVLSLSTAQVVLGETKMKSTKRTTPSPWYLQKIFRRAKREGVTHVVLEVSSHALSQRRVFAIPLDVAVLTNITPEHLDYHRTLENYADAKRLLFFRHLRKTGTAVLNFDDPIGRKWASEFSQRHSVLTFSEQGDPHANFYAESFTETEKGISFTTVCSTKHFPTMLPVFGRFNVSNALSALCSTRAVGVSEKMGRDALSSFLTVPGRMQKISSNADFSVFIDFALTPGSLEKMLLSARNMVKDDGSLTLVFGLCGSHKDIQKRRLLGKTAAQYADTIIVTDDEPYYEKPEVIRQHILKGAQEEDPDALSSGKVQEIPDREKAIFEAIAHAKTGDVLVVAGMGHLTTRNVSGEEIPWSDTEVIQKALLART